MYLGLFGGRARAVAAASAAIRDRHLPRDPRPGNLFGVRIAINCAIATAMVKFRLDVNFGDPIYLDRVRRRRWDRAPNRHREEQPNQSKSPYQKRRRCTAWLAAQAGPVVDAACRIAGNS